MRTPFSHMRPLLAILLLAVSCGGDGASPVDTNPTLETATIALSASQAAPLAEIDITGIPAGGEAYVLVTVDGSDVEGVTFLSERAVPDAGAASSQGAGSYFIRTPVHPVDPVNGGVVNLRIAGENLTSNTVTLDIGALPVATTTVQDMATVLQSMFDTWLLVHGTDRQTLRAAQEDPWSLPYPHIPLLMAFHALDNPDNPNNMRAAVDGPIPDFDNETVDWDIYNRILTAAGAEAAFARELARFDSLKADTLVVPKAARIGRSAPHYGLAGEDCFDSPGFGIDTATSLDRAMRVARFGQDRLDGASGEALVVLSVALDAATAYEMGGLAGIVQKGLKLFSNGIWVMKQMSDAAGGLMPSYFENGATDFDLTITRFNEDEDEAGKWENFRVRAWSSGWTADKFIMRTILKTAGKKLIGVVTEKFEGVEKAVLKFLMTREMKAIWVQDKDVVKICPRAWNVTFLPDESDYAKASHTGTSIELSTNNVDYHAFEPGVSQFRVETRPGYFGRNAAVASRQDIEVLYILVTIDPELVYRKPKETTTFTATVENANDKTLAWTHDARLQWVGGGTGESFITLKTPDAEWQGPLQITARAVTATGAREGKVSSDPREALASVIPLNAEIIVTPDGICVPLGTDEDFNAVVTGVSDPSVIWSASAGMFDGNTYTAPTSPVGEVTITATSVENPSLTGTATIEVSDCGCRWTAAVSGEINGVYEGKFVLWRDDYASLVWGDTGEGDTYPGFSFGPEGAITGPGAYAVLGSMAFAGGTQIYAAGEDEDLGLVLPTMTVTLLTSDTMEGFVRGQLCRPTTTEPFCAIIDIDIEFRAKHQFRGPGCGD